MPVVRAIPASTPNLCRVVAALEDLSSGRRVTVAELARTSGLSDESVRACLHRLKDALLVDAREDADRDRPGRVPRAWALTERGREQAPRIIARGPESVQLGGGR